MDNIKYYKTVNSVSTVIVDVKPSLSQIVGGCI